jgi:hypothetical protein
MLWEGKGTILSYIVVGNISYEINYSEVTVVKLSAGNTNTNFGGFFRIGKGNVLTKIRSQLNRDITVGFEVLTAVVIKSTTFWDIAPCNQLKVSLCFGGIYHLHLQGQRISRASDLRKSKW